MAAVTIRLPSCTLLSQACRHSELHSSQIGEYSFYWNVSKSRGIDSHVFCEAAVAPSVTYVPLLGRAGLNVRQTSFGLYRRQDGIENPALGVSTHVSPFTELQPV